jgi:small subunit ribosomal protein S16
MSVKIRLALTGKKHQISYRVVAQDTRSKRDGKFLEILGNVNPSEKGESSMNFKMDRINSWLSLGAKLTPGVAKLINDPKTKVINPPA